MKKRKLNVKLIRAIQKKIREVPEQFNMIDWFSSGPGIPNCGTAACIAGWAMTIHWRMSPVLAKQKRFSLLSEFGYAMRLIGISREQAETVFYSDNWPDEVSGMDESKAAIKVLNMLIDGEI